MGEELGMEGALGRVILRMTKTLAPREVLHEITHGLVDELDAALARIWLLDPGDLCPRCPHPRVAGDAAPARYLHLVASAGLPSEGEGTHRHVPVGALKIGQIAETRAPVCTNDLIRDPRIENKEWVRREGLQSFAGHAIGFRGDVLGVLAMFGRRELSAAEFDRLGLFAAQASLALENARLFDEVSRLSRRLEDENAYLREEIEAARPARILGGSPALTRALGQLERVAPTTSTVLVLGETGTGKELFARALHEKSPRRARPLVKVNCAAIPATLIESELFGHEKGAFTGAVQRRIGRFELADGGTLFLDEIGEMPLEAQAKLLRVVQDREMERVGGTQAIRVDVRIVAATNRDLAAEVKEGRFRADLFYRLNVFPIAVPPLRERREDIATLVDAFVAALGKRLGRELAGVEEDAMGALRAYDWPGNVRELENVLERAAILARGERIALEDLPELGLSLAEKVESEAAGAVEGDAGNAPLRQRVSAYERAVIADALRVAGGNQSEAARLLQTSRATLQYKMRAYRL